ncbi:MAG: DUF4397 domain-containing protein [Anaerolineae bacterium]|nr:DUF4397 domain-containing protein [Anaerolineae bacterium]
MLLRRALLVGAAVVLAGLGMLSPTAAQSPQIESYGFVRFVHTAIDMPALDIYVGEGGKSQVASNLAYGQATDFVTLPSSVQGYTVRAAGSGVDGEVLFRLNRRVKANQSEIIAAAGLNSKRAFVLESFVMVRDNTRGKARVRIYNTVWGGPYLTVRDSRDNVFGQDLQYLSISGDQDIEPGMYDFEIRSGSGKTVLAAPGMKLEADKVYAMIIVGGMDGNPPIQFVTLVSDQETTRVRLVNKGDAPADIYVKGSTSPLIMGLAAGASSDFVTIPSGATTFILRTANSAANSPEVAFVAAQLRPGRDVTITVNGSGVATQMGVTEDRLSQLITPLVINSPTSVRPTSTPPATMPGTAVG